MTWWLWLSGGVLLGWAGRLLAELQHDTRCPELTEFGEYSHTKQTVRCRLRDGHTGPCEAKYQHGSTDLVKTLGHWNPVQQKERG